MSFCNPNDIYIIKRSIFEKTYEMYVTRRIFLIIFK